MAFKKGKLHNYYLRNEFTMNGSTIPAAWVFVVDLYDESQETKKTTVLFTCSKESKFKPLKLSGAQSLSELNTKNWYWDISNKNLKDVISEDEYKAANE